ncbi:MAG: zinc/iron-chelating domain-containing protein [Deltaproteobacteria bacterium CG11_big_fil_rev_8_21_14_0_20_47_16]|nr:MAG: zinc/iron-chelating domain-containing protein [Deltaproteobacteria bacterium CG11_big_fil_rev_8_21_14_0_20_47_16]
MWWEKGIQFSCTCSGQCCRTNGKYAYVYMTLAEIRKAAAHMKMSENDFKAKYITKDGPYYYVKDPERDCHFLQKDGRCAIYPARPQQCSEWPFWGENLKSRTTWEKEVKPICRGVREGAEGKGKFYSAAEIKKILARQRD